MHNASDANFRRCDHIDIHTRLGESSEHGRRITGTILHPCPNDAHLRQLFSEIGLTELNILLLFDQFHGTPRVRIPHRESEVRRPVITRVLNDHIYAYTGIGQWPEEAAGNCSALRSTGAI